MMALARNVVTAARRPALAAEYLGWLVQRASRKGGPTRLMPGQVRLGSFANFSEYHSVGHFLSVDEFRFLTTYPFAAGAVLDIGANIGLVSLVVAKRYPDRAIHAFEPNPSTFRALSANVALNRASSVGCHELAVADATGTQLFDADPQARGTAGIVQEATRHSRSVASVTLDDFCTRAGVDRIAFIKIDVEGYETLVLRGAAHVLVHVRPAVIHFEVCPTWTECAGFDRGEPARLLLSHGYILRRWDATGALVPASLDDLRHVTTENWIAFSQ